MPPAQGAHQPASTFQCDFVGWQFILVEMFPLYRKTRIDKQKSLHSDTPKSQGQHPWESS